MGVPGPEHGRQEATTAPRRRPETGVPQDAAALIAAVRARDAEAAAGLLAAGAPPDVRDGAGYTALGLAVVHADTAMCELLVRAGADLDLRCPGGRTPVMLAADGGAIGVWHELRGGSPDFSLRDDLGRSAMDLARGWLGVDAATHLLSRLGVADDDGAEITRVPAPEVGTGSFETVRVTTRTATACVQTGHAAILTELEELLGVRPSYAELIDRALAFEPDHVGRVYPVMGLMERADDETFRAAAGGLSARDPRRRRLAAEVLRLFALHKEESETTARLEKATTELLRRRAAQEEDPQVLVEILCGLGLRFDTLGVPEILRHAGHPDPGVRAQVASCLHRMVPPGDIVALRAVLTLTQDVDARVRRCAALTLSDHHADTPVIRASLTRLMHDADPDVAIEGARGLGLRDDPSADLPLLRALRNLPGGSAPQAHPAYDAFRRIPEERCRAAGDSLGPPDPADHRP